ncbi:MAG: ATP-dependent RNA helicase DbpA [Acidimicrobiales bacterium]|nr:MAG: DEAD/DEAH box helicase [Actinomycetota bacterium]MBV6509021.1 ATP-dependent RNA helicase DbpA [Acidimicrobiales bacterium]RIK06266.1 MAG: helicase [Acidobacteriota bacterium]
MAIVTPTPDVLARRCLPVDGIDAIVADLCGSEKLLHLETLPARPASTGTLARPLPPQIEAQLPVSELWSHQAEAIDLARRGRSVVVATGTASGKSLCYQVPIAEAVTGQVPGTSLLVFPTKALAHDQLRAIGQLALDRVVPATYDGDSSRHERSWVRDNANVILTNPEMLHHGVLPHHRRWATFLMRLEYVVVDELHTLRGIFGTHVAHILRRLRRLCRHYGSDPTFIFTSATIGQPARLASELCGVEVDAVTEDGSPRGKRVIALWNPAARSNARYHPSANTETAALTARLVEAGGSTLVFCRSRKGTELVAAQITARLPEELAGQVRSYRAGYLAEERREIESELFGGQLSAVVATTALELGMDIGGLDCVVLNGFPGTVASMWQQAGRAGREGQDSLAVLVAGDDQLDQWLVRHPHELFSRGPEPAVINPRNPFVALPHLACAAFELPLTHDDELYWPDQLDDAVRQLVLRDRLRIRERPGRLPRSPAAVWHGRGWPSNAIGLRSSCGAEVRIEHAGDLVGTVDRGHAFSSVHPGALYLHRGRQYRVESLDADTGVAEVVPDDDDEYTQARSETAIRLLEVDSSRSVGRSLLSLGSVEVVEQVIGYRRCDSRTHDVISSEELDLPPTHLVTRGFWYAFDEATVAAAEVLAAELSGTLHAVEHAAIGMLPLFTICDRWDVGGVSTSHLPETGRPTVVIYDGYAGGAGIAELGYEAAGRHLGSTLEALEGCHCEDGCPSCVQSPKCGNLNEPLDKRGAIRLLRTVLTTDTPDGR